MLNPPNQSFPCHFAGPPLGSPCSVAKRMGRPSSSKGSSSNVPANSWRVHCCWFLKTRWVLENCSLGGGRWEEVRLCPSKTKTKQRKIEIILTLGIELVNYYVATDSHWCQWETRALGVVPRWQAVNGWPIWPDKSIELAPDVAYGCCFFCTVMLKEPKILKLKKVGFFSWLHSLNYQFEMPLKIGHLNPKGKNRVPTTTRPPDSSPGMPYQPLVGPRKRISMIWCLQRVHIYQPAKMVEPRLLKPTAGKGTCCLSERFSN